MHTSDMKSSKKLPQSTLSYLVAATFILMVAVNALANILPINRITTGAVSDSYPNLFAPAGITFAIWGIIYLLLAAYTVFQFDLFQTGRSKRIMQIMKQVGWYFCISSVFNTVWIFAWHYQAIGLSVVLIVGILICLIRIADILKAQKFTQIENLAIRLPFSVYFGWITVAVIANITAFLVSIGWNGWGIADSIWMIAILLVGAVIGTIRMLYDRSIPYGVVLIWAYMGIVIKHVSSTGFGGRYPEILFTVVFCMFVFGAGIFKIYRTKR